MGMFIPCLIAAVLNGCALQIFREPAKIGNGPLMALYIFISTAFLLLWSVRLYPRNFRRLGKLHCIAEFLMTEFFMEQLVTDFWFPLEKCVLESLPATADRLEDWFSDDVAKVDMITEKLRSKTVGYYVSYTLAISLLLATFHASRTIDLRTLKDDGPVCFFKEILHKIKLQKRRFLRKLGYGKKRVKINDCSRYDQAITEFGNNRKYVNRPDLHSKDKISKYCPVHNPRSDDGLDSGDYSDFEEVHHLSKYSD